MHVRGLPLGLFAAAFATIVTQPVQAQVIDLVQAANDPNFDIEISSPGGYSEVQIVLRNSGERPVQVVADIGTVLGNPSESEQNLILGEPVKVTVAPQGEARVTVPSYCINPDRGSPSAGRQFSVRAPDRELARLVESQNARADSSASRVASPSARHSAAENRGNDAVEIITVASGGSAGVRRIPIHHWSSAIGTAGAVSVGDRSAPSRRQAQSPQRAPSPIRGASPSTDGRRAASQQRPRDHGAIQSAVWEAVRRREPGGGGAPPVAGPQSAIVF